MAASAAPIFSLASDLDAAERTQDEPFPFRAMRSQPSNAQVMRPNFFIIGAPKAGTTALYHRLIEHPDVFMPALKEPHFFSEADVPNRPQSLEAYLALFEGATTERAVGEASTSYLNSPEAPARLHSFAPEARIVAVLRHPVERAFSHYLMMLNSGAIPHDAFESLALKAKSCIMQGDPVPYGSGFRQSFYAEGIARYKSFFGDEQVCVLTYDQLKKAPDAFLRTLFTHIGAEPLDALIGPLASKNVGHGVPKRSWISDLVYGGNFIKRTAQLVVPSSFRKQAAGILLNRNRTEKPRLDPNLSNDLLAMFYDDLKRTESLTGLDLSRWYFKGET